MLYLSDSALAKQIDLISSEEYMVTPAILMERAAYDMAEVLMKDVKKTSNILAVCGRGNNGGDAIAVARILYEKGYNASVYVIDDYNDLSDLSRLQFDIADKSGVTFTSAPRYNKYDVVIDGIFGIGLNKPVSGMLHNIISSINESQAKVYAVDVPSGINASTGEVMGICINASVTVTFGIMKIGLMLPPGNEYAGKVHISKSAFPNEAINEAIYETGTNIFYYDENDLSKLPKRYSDSNKGTYGKALIIAGSKGMSGAAYLSAKACYRCGCGLVRILTVNENRTILQQSLPEAIISCYGDNIEYETEEIKEMLSWADSVVIGPGIGENETSAALLDIVLNNVKCPIVLDADALNILSGRGELFNEVLNNAVITPHIKEMSRLTCVDVNTILSDTIGYAKDYASENVTVVLKNSRTIVSDGDMVYINASGNDGMATAGSGDVLTGVIAAFLAQDLPIFEAATLGVYVHGLAGNSAAEKKGHYAMIASDIIESLGEVLK